MPNLDLDAIRRANAEYAATKQKATAVPWIKAECHAGDNPEWLVRFPDGEDISLLLREEDADFITAARNTPTEQWVEKLLSEVERLQRDLNAAQEIMAGGSRWAVAMRYLIERERTEAKKEWQEENARLRGLCREALNVIGQAEEDATNEGGTSSDQARYFREERLRLRKKLKAACGE